MTDAPAPPLSALDYERLGDAVLAASDPGLASYVSGGAADEWTLKANRRAFDRWALCPRAMQAVERVDLGAEVLGARLSMPLLAAPLAYLGMAAEQGEMATARAVAAHGTAMCVSPFTTVPLGDLAAAADGPAPWFQLYLLRDRGATRALAEQAAAAGAGALVVTVDAPCLGRRERDLRSGFTISGDVPLPMLEAASSRYRGMSPVELFELVDGGASWSRIEQLAGLTALPLVVKGVLAAADARAACDHGAAGVVVSNHGGRQLDGARASLGALPEVVEGLGGRAAVLLDGGVRRAADVVKALALGADAVLLGRPVFWALAARGEEGVAHLLGLLREELELALSLLGCANLRGVRREHLRRADG